MALLTASAKKPEITVFNTGETEELIQMDVEPYFFFPKWVLIFTSKYFKWKVFRSNASVLFFHLVGKSCIVEV